MTTQDVCPDNDLTGLVLKVFHNKIVTLTWKSQARAQGGSS